MKIAVFPGSFDPFTIAHKDLVDRALPYFETIYIAIGINSTKKGLMDYDSREDAIAAVYRDNPKIMVQQFEGLTVNYCQLVEASTILRGLRNAADLEFENAIAQNNLILAPEIETFFLMSRSGFAHISSTIVRDIWVNGGSIDHLIPSEVKQFISK